MRFIFAFFLFVILAINPVQAQSPAGEAVKVRPFAELITGGAGKALQVRQPVYSGDTVRTGFAGEAQIVFRDNTRLVVGPGASLQIDQFVISDRSKAQKFAIQAYSGVFRFISGDSDSRNYSVRTPTAVIGIRGTAFDFAVGRGGRSLVMLHQGIVEVCAVAGGCRILDDRCDLAQTRQGNPAQLSSEPGFLVRRHELSRSFPYVRSQGSLREDFRLATARRCRGLVTSAATGGGGNDSNSGAGGADSDGGADTGGGDAGGGDAGGGDAGGGDAGGGDAGGGDAGGGDAGGGDAGGGDEGGGDAGGGDTGGGNNGGGDTGDGDNGGGGRGGGDTGGGDTGGGDTGGADNGGNANSRG